VALQRWGLTTIYIGPIGDDPGGVAQCESLRSEGVNIDACHLCPGVPSQCSFISVDAGAGERTIQWYRDDRLALRADQLDEARVAGARAVLLDGEDVDIAVATARCARDAGALVVLDVDEPDAGTRRLLPLADIAIVPAGFAERFARAADLADALGAICDGGPKVAVATLGDRGAVARCDGRVFRQDAFAVRPVDTTSAGDVFHAAFLYATLAGSDMDETLRFAAAAAALACTVLGGRASIPSLDAVRALMSSGEPRGASADAGKGD
jgi:sugar/nucleoside kinase (ribokinase family)